MPFPLTRRTGQVHVSIASLPVQAFPVIQAGRHPRIHFRGLLTVHSSYVPVNRSTARSGLCHEAMTRAQGGARDHLEGADATVSAPVPPITTGKSKNVVTVAIAPEMATLLWASPISNVTTSHCLSIPWIGAKDIAERTE